LILPEYLLLWQTHFQHEKSFMEGKINNTIQKFKSLDSS